MSKLRLVQNNFDGLKILIFVGFTALCPLMQPLVSANFLYEYPPFQAKIIGGEDDTILNNPHLISVRYRNVHICCGCILSNLWILTAGHCCYNKDARGMTIRHGVSNISENINTMQVVSYKLHDKFDPESLENDLCMLELKQPIEYSMATRPIKIATKDPDPGTEARVSGWGVTSPTSKQSSESLKTVEVKIIDRNYCHQTLQPIYGGTFDYSSICAGHLQGGKDACQGDSGSPLVVNNEAVAIVSYGYGCAVEGYPGVYSNAIYHRNFCNYWSSRKPKDANF